MIITCDGIRFLERVIRSCAPSAANGGMPGKKYLAKISKGGVDLDFEKFMNGFYGNNDCLSISPNVFEQIQRTAEEEKREKIDEKFVIYFFSGRPHIEKALRDVKEGDIAKIMGIKYARNAFISHILLVIEITDIADQFSGTYRNRDIIISLKNLVPFPEEKDLIERGSKVFVHNASIISGNILTETEKVVLFSQSQHEKFVEACRFAAKDGGIDHKKMLHYPWAEKIAKYKSEEE